MIKALVTELIHIISEELKIYNELLSLSKDKTDIIVKGKVNDLDNIVKAEQGHIIELGGLEGKREEIVDSIAKQINVSSSLLTMSELIKRLDQQQAQDLKKYQLDLSGVLRELKELNDLNSKLVKNSLEFIDFSINMMAGAADTGNNYGYNGQVSDQHKRNLFDMKL